ncbi:ABC transporter permease [Amycolatopsis antarctica]|uniref:ABC transporter permease n=1 Tax=Amycolatopsis antarctica TaxID=1854586 RepID=A0A263D5N6_9PSEU|nr:hypothetical protein [Amycolatopsis antarctica]OZM73691.1 ABC transporter permease [Amycolatopsis antarctica]
MLWSTWRQYRAQFLVTAVLLVALGTVLLVNGLLAAGAVERAAGAPAGSQAFVDARSEARSLFAPVSVVVSYLIAVPVLVGAFWGVPLLAREFERGTHRLAWTQSMPGHRWLGTRLGMLGVAVTAGGLIAGVMLSAWYGAYDGLGDGDPFRGTSVFPLAGIASAGWWLFAFAAGVAAGALVRRVLPAMAITLVVVAAALVLVGGVVRPHYATPERTVATSSERVAPDAKLVDIVALSPDGTERPAQGVSGLNGRTCPLVSGTSIGEECAAGSGHRLVYYSHPAERYWRFQWTEFGLLAAGALVLGGIALYRTTRRR